MLVVALQLIAGHGFPAVLYNVGKDGTRSLQQHATVELLCRSIQRCNLVKMLATMPMDCNSIEIAKPPTNANRDTSA